MNVLVLNELTWPVYVGGLFGDHQAVGLNRSTVCAPRSLMSESRSSQAPWFSRSPVVKAITSGLPHLLLDERAKGCVRGLTIQFGLRILDHGSHGHPSTFGVSLPASIGYWAPILHHLKNTTVELEQNPDDRTQVAIHIQLFIYEYTVTERIEDGRRRGSGGFAEDSTSTIRTHHTATGPISDRYALENDRTDMRISRSRPARPCPARSGRPKDAH